MSEYIADTHIPGAGWKSDLPEGVRDKQDYKEYLAEREAHEKEAAVGRLSNLVDVLSANEINNMVDAYGDRPKEESMTTPPTGEVQPQPETNSSTTGWDNLAVQEFSDKIANMPIGPKREYGDIPIDSVGKISEPVVEYSEFHEKAFSPAEVSTTTLADIQEIKASKMTPESFNASEALFNTRALEGQIMNGLRDNPTNINIMKLALMIPNQFFMENYEDRELKEQYATLNNDIDKIYEAVGKERQHTGNMYDQEPARALVKLLDKIRSVDDEKLKDVLGQSSAVVGKIFKLFADASDKKGINYTTYADIRSILNNKGLENILAPNLIAQLPYLKDSDVARARRNEQDDQNKRNP